MTTQIWKFEGTAYSRKTGAYVAANCWSCKVGDRVWDGFGTKREAKAYAERVINNDI